MTKHLNGDTTRGHMETLGLESKAGRSEVSLSTNTVRENKEKRTDQYEALRNTATNRTVQQQQIRELRSEKRLAVESTRNSKMGGGLKEPARRENCQYIVTAPGQSHTLRTMEVQRIAEVPRGRHSLILW